MLELRDSAGTLIQANDNWRDTQEQAIQGTGLAPSSDQESAILASLEPGAYTAVVHGANNATGIGLAEIYDLQSDSASSLANISTRGFVGAGENVMIGGVILSGPDTAGVLFRAIGPSLAGQGIQNALADPRLELFDGQGTTIASNDNWRDSQEQAILDTGAAPVAEAESAILADLTPGSYTAVVTGISGGTGTALVEAYYLQ